MNGEIHTPEMKIESQNRTKKRQNSTDAKNPIKSSFDEQYSQRRKRAKINALDSQACDKQQYLR